MSMDTQESDLIQQQARRVLAEPAIAVRLRELLETTNAFDRETWSQIAELGWLGVTVETDGGLGLPDSALAVIAEEIGRMPSGIPFGPTVYVAAEALSRWGSRGLREQWLSPLISGAVIGAFAFAEAGEGGMPQRPAVQFRDGELSGEKVAVAAGAYADFAIVVCSQSQRDEAALAFVDLKQPGVRRVTIESLDNSLGYANLNFEGCAAVQLDAPAHAAHAMFDRAALFTAFEQIGGAESCLEAARQYALVRRVFGQPIGAFQGIKHKLADMYALLQVARGAAISALDATPDELPLACASARHAAIKAYDFCAQENIQVHGGIGVTWEAMCHLHYRRARCLALQWGGAPYWRERVLAGVRSLPSHTLA